MACYRPLRAFKGSRRADGKVNVVWRRSEAVGPSPELHLPCGQCIGCRLERSRQWAMRCMHEAKLHDRNCFLTLTYADEYLPWDNSLVLSHFQDFMKRLRKRYACDCKVGRRKTCKLHGIRFFHCGEYGEKLGRPHYHAIVFNFDFPDKKLFTVSNGNNLFTSEQLDELWPLGHALIGAVTFDSAAYVARYVVKKFTGEGADEHYQGRIPEYVTMSRRPGIGQGWFARYGDDVFPSDEVLVRGIPSKPPRYYDNILGEINPDLLRKIKLRRSAGAPRLVLSTVDGVEQLVCESDDVRLRVKEEVKLAQIASLKRNLED